MCLKRYSLLPNGNAIRLNTYIDIPTQIGLPHFIQDDKLDEDGLLYGNFKLLLQSVVCHRGNSVDSGHYIALVRGTNPTAAPSTSHSFNSDSNPLLSSDSQEHWMRFDDLAAERVTRVNIEQALKEESPYLLFYQIVPIDENTSTEESASDTRFSFNREPEDPKAGGIEKEDFIPTTNLELPPYSSTPPASVRLSFDFPGLHPPEHIDNYNPSEVSDKTTTNGVNDGMQGRAVMRNTLSPRRSSSLPRHKKESSRSRSRGGDHSAEKRIGAAFSKFTMRMSKDKAADDNDASADVDGGVSPTTAEETEVHDEKRGRESAFKKDHGKQRQRIRNNPDRECVMM